MEAPLTRIFMLKEHINRTRECCFRVKPQENF
jgi:hypothetical protein